MKNTLYLLFLITLLQGCLFPTEKGKGTIDLRSQRDGGPNDLSDNSSPSTFSSITLNNDQITIDGSDLNGITEVKLQGSGLNDVLSIVSQTATQIVLSYASNLVLPLGSLVDIVITDAGAASSTTVTFQLPNDSVGTVQIVDDAVTTAKITDGAITAAKLNDMGAANGDVLVYNTGSTSWVPTPLSGLNYIGSWNANTNAPSLSDGGATTSPSAGDYYVTSVTGATSIDGESTWIAGDWIIYNGSDWQRINNAGTVLSFNGRTGAIVSATNDYTWAQINMGTSSIDDIADIDTSTVSPNDGEVLKWNNATGKWEPAADETAGAGSVGSSEIADGSIASADLSSDSVTSAKIADGSIVNADINASAAIDYSKLSIADNDLSIAKTNGLQTNLDDLSSDIASNAAAITTKEPTITAAATTTYYRGDKTFVTLNTAVVPESGSLYFSEARVLGTQLAGYSTGSSLALANGDSLIVALGKLEAQITSVDSSADGALQKDGSNSMTGDLDLGTNDITNAAAGTFSGTVSASNFIGSGAGLTGLVADPSNDSVTSSKIADGSILTADLSDDAITSAKIANVSVSKITSGAGAYLTYMPNNVECSDGEVLAWSVSNRWECASAGAAGTVTSITGGAGLTDGPFTTTGTININVDNTTIEVSSDTLMIKDNAITTAKVLDDAITTAKILDGEILSADLTNDSITSAKIVNDTITSADINTSAAIEYSKLNIADSDLTIAKTSGLQTLLDDLSSDVASLDSSNDGLYSLDGSKALSGTMQLNDNWISNDGGAEGIRIDDSGNVGIGTTAPSRLLDIASTSGSNLIRLRSGAKSWFSGVNTGDDFAIYEDAGSNSPAFLIQAGGNVGIATTNPSAELDVSGDITASGSITATSFAGDGSGLTGITGLSNNSVTSAKIINNEIVNEDINSAAAIAYSKLNIADNDLTIAKTSGLQTLLDDLSSDVTSIESTFYKLDGSSALTGTMQLNDNWISNDGGAEGIRITDSGNVGIGTTAPQSNLSVIAVAGSSSGGVSILSSSDSDNPRVKLRTTSADRGLIELYDQNEVVTVDLRSYSNGSGLVLNDGSADTKIKLSSVSGQDNYFNNSANVGIGTISPGASLHVEGFSGRNFISKTSNDFVGEFISTDPNAYLVIEDSTSTNDGNSIGVTGDDMKFRTANIERMIIDSSGDVGIGTSLPNEKLTIEGAISFKEILPPTTDIATYHKLYVDSSDDNLKFRDDTGTVFNLTASGNFTMEDWQTPIFENSWVNYGNGYNTAAYYKDPFGRVHLKGLVKSGVIDTCIFTLPVGHRPVSTELIGSNSHPNSFSRVDITTAGCVSPRVGSNAWFSLDGISFNSSSGATFSGNANPWAVSGSDVSYTAGNVGIGTASPLELLDITSLLANKTKISMNQRYNSGATSMGIDFYRTYDTGGDNQLAGFIRLQRAGGNTNDGLQFAAANQGITPTAQMTLDPSGNLGIGTTAPNDALDVVGDIDATGCFQNSDAGTIGGTCVSDERLKENILPLENSLNRILDLRPVSYIWRAEYAEVHKKKGQEIGLIAQEVEQVFPELVVKKKDGFKRVKHDITMRLHIINAIKEFFELFSADKEDKGRRIASLEVENSQIEKEITVIKSENKVLKNKVLLMEKAICELNPKSEICKLHH